MRFLAIIVVITILVALGLLFIITGQQQISGLQHNKLEELQSQEAKLNVDLSNANILKATLVKLVTEGSAVMKDMDDRMDKQAQEIEEKKKESEVCEGEKTAKNNKLAELQKEKGDAEGQFKTESEEWNKEITSLKEQLATRSKICDYVPKTNTAAEKLCDLK